MLIYLLFIFVLIKTVFSNEPQIIPFSIPNDLIHGSNVKLMCSVSKGSHPLKFEWFFNSHNLYETNDLFLQNLDDASILNIKNLNYNHNGNYSCVVNNRFGKDTFTTSLIINAPSQWIKKPPESLKVKENSSLLIPCIADGHPSPKISWHKTISLLKDDKDNSKQEKISHQQLKVMPNGTLELNYIQKGDEGEYTCTVDNSIGEKLTSKTTITVLMAAKVTMITDHGQELINTNLNDIPITQVKKGESFNLRCAAIGDFPITIDWYKDSKLMQYKFSSNMETINTQTTSKLISELHFKSIGRSDSGLYECKAKNELGESKKSQKLSVLETPDSPTDLTLNELESNSVKVSWKLNYNGNSEIIKILIYFWENNKNFRRNNNNKLNQVEVDLPTSKSHVLKNLKSGVSYFLAITCVNSIGESPLSEQIEFQTKLKSPIHPPTDLTVNKIFSNKIYLSWKFSENEHYNSNITGFQVFYKPIDEQNFFIERVIVKENDLQLNNTIFSTLINLKKDTRYIIKVKAYNKEGYSPDSEEIYCKTLRGNLPNAPKITQHQIHSKSYLTVKWEFYENQLNPTLNAALRHQDNINSESLKTDKEVSFLQDFDDSLQYFMAYVEVSDLKMIVQTIPIPPSQRQVTISNLEKDIKYEIYITAFNGHGESPLSDPLLITLRSYQYDMSIFMAERNALIVTAVSIGIAAILVSIICSIVYMKRFQIAQQEKIRKMSTLTLSKYSTSKSTATYATIGTNAPSSSTGFTNYNAQLGHLNQQATYMTTTNQPVSNGYQEIGLTYDLDTGGLCAGPVLPKINSINNTPQLTTFGHVTIRSADSNTQSSEGLQTMQFKDRLDQHKPLDTFKNIRTFDDSIYDDALG